MTTSAPTTIPILWLHGADAVGKTTVGWEIYTRLADRGVGVAYVDTDNLGFVTPSYDDPIELVARNLASMWPNFAEAGGRCLVVAGIIVTPEHRRRIEAAIPGTALTLVRLTATPATISERIVRRGRIEGADSDGAVSGLTLDGLDEYATRAAGFAARLDADGLADVAVATDGLAVPRVATHVLAAVPGWPEAHIGR